MSNENESEYRDVTPEMENLPNKGRGAIITILGGVIILVLAIVGLRLRTVGLAVGGGAFIFGIQMMLRRKKFNFKMALIVTIAGFLMLLTYPGIGIVKAVAAYILITGAIGLIVFGLGRAIKLSWDLGKRS